MPSGESSEDVKMKSVSFEEDGNPNRNADGTFASSGGDQTGGSSDSKSPDPPKPAKKKNHWSAPREHYETMKDSEKQDLFNKALGDSAKDYEFDSKMPLKDMPDREKDLVEDEMRFSVLNNKDGKATITKFDPRTGQFEQQPGDGHPHKDESGGYHSGPRNWDDMKRDTSLARSELNAAKKKYVKAQYTLQDAKDRNDTGHFGIDHAEQYLGYAEDRKKQARDNLYDLETEQDSFVHPPAYTERDFDVDKAKDFLEYLGRGQRSVSVIRGSGNDASKERDHLTNVFSDLGLVSTSRPLNRWSETTSITKLGRKALKNWNLKSTKESLSNIDFEDKQLSQECSPCNTFVDFVKKQMKCIKLKAKEGQSYGLLYDQPEVDGKKIKGTLAYAGVSLNNRLYLPEELAKGDGMTVPLILNHASTAGAEEELDRLPQKFLNGLQNGEEMKVGEVTLKWEADDLTLYYEGTVEDKFFQKEVDDANMAVSLGMYYDSDSPQVCDRDCYTMIKGAEFHEVSLVYHAGFPVATIEANEAKIRIKALEALDNAKTIKCLKDIRLSS